MSPGLHKPFISLKYWQSLHLASKARLKIDLALRAIMEELHRLRERKEIEKNISTSQGGAKMEMSVSNKWHICEKGTISADQSEFNEIIKKTPDIQFKSVMAVLNQHAQNNEFSRGIQMGCWNTEMAWHNIKVTHQEFEMQWATVGAWMRFKGKAGIRIVVVVTKVWCIHILDSAENRTSIHHSAEASYQYPTCIPRCSNTWYHHSTERLLWRSPADDSNMISKLGHSWVASLYMNFQQSLSS